MKTKSIMFVLFLAFLFGSATQIFAFSSYRTSFSNKYPSASATLKDCSLCHPGGDTGSLNSFATSFASNNFTFDATLENMDSDKDGATNIAEINAGTFPGDPASKPAPAQVSVPSLAGRTETAARTTITGAGLTVGTVTTQSSATVATGQVISQNPAAGASAAPGSAVSFVVSSGVAQVSVPTVTGRTEAVARTTITGAGLTVGTVSTQSSATVAAGQVISQSPAAGASAAPGSAVSFVVSSGVAQVSVPTVTGRTEAAARTTITGAGLTVGTVTTQSSATVAAGQVISQSPAAGASAAPGSAVSFVVSSGPETPPPAQTSLIFSDDFSDSKASGDPNWERISGRWAGNGSILMSSSRESNNAALVRDVPGLNPFAVGRLQADIKLSNSKDANGAVIFGYRDSSHYKYVRLYRNKVVIGQVGSFDGEQGGIKALGYGRFAANAWHTVQIDVDMRGSVRVYVDKEDNATLDDDDDDEGISDDDSDDDDWGASVSYRFRNVSPGRVGSTAAKTITSFDNFFAWDSSVLPAQPADPRDDD